MHTWLTPSNDCKLRSRSDCGVPALQAGLSALKTPQSYQGGCNREDPLHLKARGWAQGPCFRSAAAMNQGVNSPSFD